MTDFASTFERVASEMEAYIAPRVYQRSTLMVDRGDFSHTRVRGHLPTDGVVIGGRWQDSGNGRVYALSADDYAAMPQSWRDAIDAWRQHGLSDGWPHVVDFAERVAAAIHGWPADIAPTGDEYTDRIAIRDREFHRPMRHAAA